MSSADVSQHANLCVKAQSIPSGTQETNPLTETNEMLIMYANAVGRIQSG